MGPEPQVQVHVRESKPRYPDDRDAGDPDEHCHVKVAEWDDESNANTSYAVPN